MRPLDLFLVLLKTTVNIWRDSATTCREWMTLFSRCGRERWKLFKLSKNQRLCLIRAWREFLTIQEAFQVDQSITLNRAGSVWTEEIWDPDHNQAKVSTLRSSAWAKMISYFSDRCQSQQMTANRTVTGGQTLRRPPPLHPHREIVSLRRWFSF